MRKTTKLPREQLRNDDVLGSGPTDQDVEGHVRLPGSGGDFHKPSGGEQGHEFMPQLPGTGGDISHRPSDGGE